MKVYDCDGQELNVGDDVIYVGINTGYPDAKIGMVYTIINLVMGYDKDLRFVCGLVFDCHPWGPDRRNYIGSIPSKYKKIDYSKKIDDYESDQNSNETPAFKLAL